MSKLGQFYLKFAFMSARPQREDVQYQSCSVNHSTLCQPLEISLLNRRDRLIHNHQIGAFLFYQCSDFLSLTTPNKSAGLRNTPGCPYPTRNGCAGRLRKTRQFIKVRLQHPANRTLMYEDGTLGLVPSRLGIAGDRQIGTRSARPRFATTRACVPSINEVSINP